MKKLISILVLGLFLAGLGCTTPVNYRIQAPEDVKVVGLKEDATTYKVTVKGVECMVTPAPDKSFYIYECTNFIHRTYPSDVIYRKFMTNKELDLNTAIVVDR